LSAHERRHILEVLRKTRGVIEGPQGAAQLLKLKPSTARFRIRKLGIQRSEYM
jgi:transcriptional regulator with GAF, ATPase, and Fis domain